MSDAALAAILKKRRSRPDQLIEVLQDVQEMDGYISETSMRAISKELGVPLLEVYSVASFYKAFSLKPRGKYVITICTGTACHVRGAGLILNQAQAQLNLAPGETSADGLFTIEQVNCLGACALGPVVTNNNRYYHHMDPNKMRKLINTARKKEHKENS